MNFGEKSVRRRSDASVSQADFELNLQLLGGSRHRLAHRAKGRDVRLLLPRIPLKLAPGDWVFAIVPAGRTWRRVCWRSARVTAITQNGATVITEEMRTFSAVPPAMIIPQRSGPLKPGQVVRAHSGRRLPFGRVVKARLTTVQVRTPWLGRSRVVRVHRREVLPVRQGLYRAAPVTYRRASTRRESSRRLGSLVALERKYRWVLGAEGVVHRLRWDRVKPVDIARRYQPGDLVRAALPVGLKIASVTRALGQHVLYEVSWSQTQRALVPFSQLAPP
jgi:hypothetical protein